MKNTSLLIAAGALAGVALLTTAPLQAGGKAVAPKNPPPELPMDNLLDPIETTLSSGYDSLYQFRGSSVGQDAIWTGLDFSLPLGLPVGNFVLNWGVWYINPTDGGQNTTLRGGLDDEIDYYASIGTTVGAFDIAIGWTHYSFLDSSGANVAATGAPALETGDQDEVGITIGTTIDTPLVPIDLSAGYYYNFDIGDPQYLENAGGDFATPQHVADTGLSFLEHYFEAGIGTTLDITDRIGLALGVTAGWFSDEFSHLEYRAALPIQIAENVVFEPYVAYLQEESAGDLHDQTRPGGPFTGTDSDLFGGVSLSVSF
jgi:hypothetical protein